MGVILIGRNDDIHEVRRKIEVDLKSRKSLRPREYLGKMRLKGDALDYQKRIRNEWKRSEYTD